jgi:LysR family transcriptional regulator for bpeEF and oprC
MDRLNALNVFCAVVDAGGFSRAADKLGVSTSSVTNQVLALEGHFNIKLLNRTTRRMSLTDEGRQCYEQAQTLLRDMSELESDMQDSNQHPRGSLRVDMPAIISRTLVAPALSRFIANYPDIRLQMMAGDRTIDLVEEGVDVVIRIGDLASSNLIARPLATTEYICCASPDYVATHGEPQSPEQLADFSCLTFVYPKSHKPRPWRFQRDGERIRHSPQGVLETDHVESLIEAAKAGCGIVQLLSLSVAGAIRAGELVPLLVDYKAPGPQVSALYQQRHHRAAKVKVFVDFVADLFASHT